MTGARDASEITSLILKHRALLFGYIVAQTGDYARAEDLFQEVSLAVCENFSKFERGSNFAAWAMQIARFKILHSYRDPAARKTVRLTPRIADLMADPGVWPDDLEAVARRQAALRRCLEKVSDKSRALLVGRFGQNRSPRDIARSLGWSTEAVYVAVSRLKDALLKCVRELLSAEGCP
jgi:RNA polymerase sigma-70 factor (ECF subfamily)